MDLTSSAWPMDGLLIRHRGLELRAVREADLPELAALHPDDDEHDPRIMRFPFQTRDEHRVRLTFQGYWQTRGSWTPESWCLDLLALEAGRVVGVQSLEADGFASLGTVDSHSWLIKEVRGRGLGVAMREAVLGLAFDHLGARAAVSSARMDNAASLGVSLRCGYTDNGISMTTSEDGAAQLQHLRLTAEEWRAAPRRDVLASGIERCLPWFGAT